MVDIAASYHAIPRGDILATYKTGNYGIVGMGNSSFFDIVGIDDIIGCIIVLKGVRHVSDLRLNLNQSTPLINRVTTTSSVRVLGN